MEPKYRATITLRSHPGQAAPDSYVELRGPWGAVKVHDPHTWGDINEGFARDKLKAAAAEDAARHGLTLAEEDIEISVVRGTQK